MLTILETASHPNATDWDYRADIVTRPIGNTRSTIVLHPRIPADECYAIACVSADPMENVVRVVRGGVIHEAIYFAECQQPQFMWCGENIYIIGNGVSVITGGVIRAFNIPYYQCGGRGYVNPMPGLACRSALRNIGTYREIKVVFPLHSWGIPCGITDHALVSGEDAQHMIDIPFGSWQAGCEIVAGIIALATVPRKEHRTPREPAAIICDLALHAWYYIDDIPECESIRTVNRLGKGRSAREQSEWSEAMQGVCMSGSPQWAHLLLD